MNDKIMHIIDLVKMIEEMEYIDCKKNNYYDVTYESILFYLKFCQGLVLNTKEEKKIPEKLSTWYSVEVTQSDEENVEYENYNFETMYKKINEIIDYLKSKGDE